MDNQPPLKHKRRRWLIVVAAIAILIGLDQLIPNRFGEEEKALRRQFRKSVEERFPEQAAAVRDSFGLRPFENH